MVKEVVDQVVEEVAVQIVMEVAVQVVNVVGQVLVIDQKEVVIYCGPLVVEIVDSSIVDN